MSNEEFHLDQYQIAVEVIDLNPTWDKGIYYIKENATIIAKGEVMLPKNCTPSRASFLAFEDWDCGDRPRNVERSE